MATDAPAHCASRDDRPPVDTAPAHLRLGPVGLRINGDHPVAERLATVLATGQVDGSEDPRPQLDLVVGSVPPPDARDLHVHRSRRFPYRFETRSRPGGARFDLTTRGGRPIHAMEFDGHPLRGNPWTATGHLQTSRVRALIPRLAVRTVTREHDHWDGVLSAILGAEVLEPLLWLALLDHGATLVHAGSLVAPSGTGVLLTGAGGAGKTPTVLSAVLDHGWRHVGDDLTIVGPDGMTHLPRPVRLAHHHGTLVRALSGHPDVPRPGRRRRVLPVDLLGAGRVARHAPLTRVVDLVEAPTAAHVTVATTPRADLVRRACAILCNEFWELLRFLNALAVLDADAASIADVHQRTAAVLDRHLPAGDPLQLRIPPRTPAHHVVAALADAVG